MGLGSVEDGDAIVFIELVDCAGVVAEEFGEYCADSLQRIFPGALVVIDAAFNLAHDRFLPIFVDPRLREGAVTALQGTFRQKEHAIAVEVQGRGCGSLPGSSGGRARPDRGR